MGILRKSGRAECKDGVTLLSGVSQVCLGPGSPKIPPPQFGRLLSAAWVLLAHPLSAGTISDLMGGAQLSWALGDIPGCLLEADQGRRQKS